MSDFRRKQRREYKELNTAAICEQKKNQDPPTTRIVTEIKPLSSWPMPNLSAKFHRNPLRIVPVFHPVKIDCPRNAAQVYTSSTEVTINGRTIDRLIGLILFNRTLARSTNLSTRSNSNCLYNLRNRTHNKSLINKTSQLNEKDFIKQVSKKVSK